MTRASNPAITRVWLIRHGEPEAEARNRCYGRLDLGLSLQGLRQIERVAARLSKEPLAAIYASPRRRALESAFHIAAPHHLKVEVIEELCEIHFGDFEGLPYEEIQQLHPELYRQWMERPTEIQFPNGESFAEMWARVTGAAQLLRQRHRGQSIAIVSHGGVNRILLAEALSMLLASLFRIGQCYAAVNLVTYFEEIPLVEVINELQFQS